ncbi:hypothetical protein, partial [Rheinheimera sp. UJ63]
IDCELLKSVLCIQSEAFASVSFRFTDRMSLPLSLSVDAHYRDLKNMFKIFFSKKGSFGCFLNDPMVYWAI